MQNIVGGKTISYCGGFVYEDGKLAYILNSEGRYVVGDKSSVYEYNICDHLGNVRAVVDAAGTVKQQSNYYPFGGVFAQAGSPDNKYLYNGKEKQEGSDWLDYGKRMYDPFTVRFLTHDPLAESYYSYSPYNYVGGNPIIRIDENGEFWVQAGAALLGAAIDYGTQVATNVYNNGGMSVESFTENINLTSIAVAAGEGFMTSGASIGKTLLLKTTAAVINNVVEVKTSADGLNVKVESDVMNVVKNSALDLMIDGVTNGLTPSSKTFKKGLSKMKINKGNLVKVTKKGMKIVGSNVTRKANNKIKSGVTKSINGTFETMKTVINTTVKTTTNAKKDEIKKKTDR